MSDPSITRGATEDGRLGACADRAADASHSSPQAVSIKDGIPDAATVTALRECFYALVGLHIATGKKSDTADWALHNAAKELSRLGHPAGFDPTIA